MIIRSILCLLLLLSIPAGAVDFTTLQGKVLFGYQGWFDCPGSWGGAWTHWARGVPNATNLTVEAYPDLKEFAAAQDLCVAGSLTINGSPAYFYSARNSAIVDRHFKWMMDYGLDGVLVQRFVTGLSGFRSGGDVVLKNIIAASQKYGRAIAVEYDVSGASFTTWATDIETDWQYLVDSVLITALPNYLHHKGRPLVSVWGIGLLDGNNHPPTNPADALAFIQWFHTNAPEKYKASFMGGTPAGWRTLNRDARTDPAWLNVYKAMDAVQPWNVGRYTDTNAVNGWWHNDLVADKRWLDSTGVLYMPVIFPGFSWSNWNGGTPNQIPRAGGKFVWQQAYNVIGLGIPAIKIAMFDEVDEATAMYKIAATRRDAPDQAYWVTLDADGYRLPTDWYLRLGSCITCELHGWRALSRNIPISADSAWKDSLSCRQIAGIAGDVRRNGMSFGLTITKGTISFQGPGAVPSLVIYDLKGRELRRLIPVNGKARWNCRDFRGSRSAPGVFLIGVKDRHGPVIKIVSE